LFYRSLRAIEHALSATREYMTKDGIIYIHLSRAPQH